MPEPTIPPMHARATAPCRRLRRPLSAALLAAALQACGSSGEDGTGGEPRNTDGAAGDAGTLSYGGVGYALTHGFEEAFSFRPRRPQGRGDTHASGELAVADAEFRTVFLPAVGAAASRVLWRPNGASVWLRVRLFSPGGERVGSGTFAHAPESFDERGPEAAGRFFFKDGRFGVDVDGNGAIESEANEFVDVVGGTVTVTRSADGTRMSVELTLADGVTLEGAFEGVFPLYES